MLEAVPRKIQNQNIILFAGMAELADALDSGSSLCKEVQVQVLLPAPKIWRRASARLHIFRFGYGSQNLLNAAGVGSRQRLAVCEANGDFSRQDKLAAERSEAVSPVTRTNKKEELQLLFCFLGFLHHFDLKKCLLKKLFPTILTRFWGCAILTLQ